MLYIRVNGEANGTGILNTITGEFVSPEELFLSEELKDRIATWLSKYKLEHETGYQNVDVIEELDLEGIEIGYLIKDEMSKIKIEYISEATLKKELL